MFQNYLKIALRNLLNNKVYSGINILGLAIGMAVAMLIGIWVADEYTFDHYLPHPERLAQI
jgi:putative ABC transport system permease protein